MNLGVSTRSATAADIGEIADIYRQHVLTGTATFEEDPPDRDEMHRRWSSLSDGGYPYLVAVLNCGVAGYAYAGPYRPRAAYRFTVEDSVYIHPRLIGKGIGRVLLTDLLEACAAREYKEVIAVIGDSANTASVRLHSALGFGTVGVLSNVGYKFNRWLDTVLMQRSLTAAPDSVHLPS